MMWANPQTSKGNKKESKQKIRAATTESRSRNKKNTKYYGVTSKVELESEKNSHNPALGLGPVTSTFHAYLANLLVMLEWWLQINKYLKCIGLHCHYYYFGVR